MRKERKIQKSNEDLQAEFNKEERKKQWSVENCIFYPEKKQNITRGKYVNKVGES